MAKKSTSKPRQVKSDRRKLGAPPKPTVGQKMEQARLADGRFAVGKRGK